FVLVLDPNDNDPVEILLSKDGTLPIASLDHAFPGAHGLKYKNPNTGGKRIVSYVYIDVKTETIENETTFNLKRKHEELIENKNNNNKVFKKNNSLVEEVVEKSNIEKVVNEEIKDFTVNVNSKEELISKSLVKIGNFEFPPTVAGKVPSDLVIFGLPYDLEEKTLKDYFEQFGAVEYLEIKRKPDQTSRGFAFVRMVNYIDQIRALSVSTHNIGGRECILKLSVTDKGRGSGFYDNISAQPRLYVGALAGDVGRDHLREYLIDHLHRFDKRSAILEMFYPNPFRHFAFVTVTTSLAARELLRQRDFFIEGHYFMLTLAMPKKGEEIVTTPGIVAPSLQNQRSGPPPVINNWLPDTYWNNHRKQHSSIPPPLPQQQPIKYTQQYFGAFKGSIKEYIGQRNVRRGSISSDYALPPRIERGPPNKPNPPTFNQSSVFQYSTPSPSYNPTYDNSNLSFKNSHNLENVKNKKGMTKKLNNNSNNKQPILVYLNNRLFDITEFAPRHPGGNKLIEIAAGSDIKQFLEGKEEINGFKHEHSKAAYDILNRYSLDKQFKNDPFIDTQNPILMNIGELGEYYWTWIHQPFDGSVRMFQSNFLEQLTRTKWWIIPLVWLPLVTFFLLQGYNLLINDFGQSIGFFFTFSLFMFGILIWTLLEYSLHRFIFHWHPNPNSKQQLTLHFLIHGLHHKTPLDKDRLVFPPAAALIFIGLFYCFYRLLLPYPIFCCFGSGKLTGYIIYDMIHYYLHHGSPKSNSKWHKRKIYHHNHHFKDSESGFGISTKLWLFLFCF
ncbi:RRM domain-containing protein, partial [Meloidogyne graminicola]